MSEDLQEQAYWMLLAFESGLNTHIVNTFLEACCYQGKHSLQEFFAASPQVCNDTCHLSSDNSKKLELAKEKLSRQVSLIEQLSHDHIHLLTVLEDNYPRLLKSSLKREQRPPVLFYARDLSILERQTIAIIGSRKAGEESASATSALSQNQPLYVRETSSSSTLPGNKALIELGGHPLPWPTELLADVLSPFIQKSAVLRQGKSDEPLNAHQLSLFGSTGE